MYQFAEGHGNALFGTEHGQTFCADFANKCIDAGGGKMPDIITWIEEHTDEWIAEFTGIGAKRKSIEQIAKEGPVPSKMAKFIRQWNSQMNMNYIPLRAEK